MENNESLPTHIRATGFKKICLGAGKTRPAGFLRVDMEETYKPEICMDLNQDWKFPKDWFVHVLAEHILEHIVDVPKFINQCWDVLVPKGILEIVVPYWAGKWAMGDPTHIHFFNQDSFNGWTNWFAEYRHLNQGRRFSVESYDQLLDPEECPIEQSVFFGYAKILGMHLKLRKEV